MTYDLFPSWFMLASVVVAIGVFGHYGWVKRDYFILAALVPLFELAVYYGCVAAEVDPVHNDPAMRLALFRPGLWFSVMFFCLHLVNGRLNRMLDKVLLTIQTCVRRWVRTLQGRMRRWTSNWRI